ncbi:hypothetical protein EVAR_33240_1 [Eumeta japonica]|uniref:Uncharacterized protein n=1 Tax=Eumeta variegata TaxID=151549 RepID=A0A4C1X2M6_EUMVA|nr:hypothetical protein EVAR_33240_1 [Eumeta japonica]
MWVVLGDAVRSGDNRTGPLRRKLNVFPGMSSIWFGPTQPKRSSVDSPTTRVYNVSVVGKILTVVDYTRRAEFKYMSGIYRNRTWRLLARGTVPTTELSGILMQYKRLINNVFPSIRSCTSLAEIIFDSAEPSGRYLAVRTALLRINP